MAKKKMISVLLVVISLLSFCSFSSFAAQDLNINTAEMDWSATYRVPTAQISNDITSEVVKGSWNGGVFNGFTSFKIPNKYYNSSGSFRLLSLSSPFTLRAEHEYNVNFGYGQNFTTTLKCDVYLYVYTSSGDLFKSIPLYSSSSRNSYSVTSPEFNFLVKSSDLPDGYVCRFSVIFEQSGSANTSLDGYVLISPQIALTDLDDNSSWLERILQAILDIPQKIKHLFTNLSNQIGDFFSSLGDKIGGFFRQLGDDIKAKFADLKSWIDNLGENIKQWFIDLGNDIGEFFTMLKNYLLYFQHPVTVNSDGVLIGADGKPVYTNPFNSVIDKVETTVNGWITTIKNFCNSIDENANSVSEWLTTGSSLIQKVIVAVPILAVLVGFGIALIVIRKVVGR